MNSDEWNESPNVLFITTDGVLFSNSKVVFISVTRRYIALQGLHPSDRFINLSRMGIVQGKAFYCRSRGENPPCTSLWRK